MHSASRRLSRPRRITKENSSVYSFNNVRLRRLKMAQLNTALKERPLDVDLPDVQELIETEQFCLVDTVWTSRDLNLSVKSSDSVDLGVSAKALFEALGNAKVSYSQKSATELTATFKGNKDLTFAYSLVPMRVNQQGRLIFHDKPTPPPTTMAGAASAIRVNPQAYPRWTLRRFSARALRRSGSGRTSSPVSSQW